MTAPIRTAVPRYNLPKIFQLRKLLADDALSEFSGFAPRGVHFEELVDKACDAVGGIEHHVMYDSLRYIAGTLITEEELQSLSWRIAGNVERLRSGVVVPPWHIQREREWMPTQVYAWAYEQSARGCPGSRLSLRVLAGTACPLRITIFWPRGFCHMVARRVGYTSRRHAYPLSHLSELVNMRIWILVDPEHCRLGSPGFREVRCTPSMLKWNRRIISKRWRKHGFRCPRSSDQRCFKCHVGYLECPAATRRETTENETENHGARDGAERNNSRGCCSQSGPWRPNVR